MSRAPLLASLLAILALPFVAAGCNDGHHRDHGGETDVIGFVLLNGVGVGGANVRIIGGGFILDTEVTASDGSFIFDDFPEDFEPFFVEAFYIDPLTLFEYKGVTPFFLTNDTGATDVGNINLVQTFPVTAPGAQNATGHLDSDPIVDLAIAFPEFLAVRLASGETSVVAMATEDGGPFGPVAIQDFDGDGLMDVTVTRLGNGTTDVYLGDGKGGFTRP